MSPNFGIIGLAKSGKTTIFNALTKSKAGTETLTPHIGIAKTSDPRLKMLDDILHPKRFVAAEATYIDIGASAKGPARDGVINDQILSQISNIDAPINIVRSFTDDSTPHTEGSLNVERDIVTMDLELALSDSAIIGKRLERIDISLKGAKQSEHQGLLRAQELLTKVKTDLEKNVPIREIELTIDEARTIASYQFLTAKPLLIIVNIGEEQLPQATHLEAELSSRYSRPSCRIITLCGKLEMELTQLDESAADAFRAEFGMKESGLDHVIKLSYELLGLISFFSIASGEVKA